MIDQIIQHYAKVIKSKDAEIEQLTKENEKYQQWAKAIQKYESWKDENAKLKERLKGIEEVWYSLPPSVRMMEHYPTTLPNNFNEDIWQAIKKAVKE